MSLRHLTQLYRPSCLFVASSALVLLAGSDFSSAGIQGTGRMALLASVGRITSSGDTISVKRFVRYKVGDAGDAPGVAESPLPVGT